MGYDQIELLHDSLDIISSVNNVIMHRMTLLVLEQSTKKQKDTKEEDIIKDASDL